MRIVWLCTLFTATSRFRLQLKVPANDKMQARTQVAGLGGEQDLLEGASNDL